MPRINGPTQPPRTESTVTPKPVIIQCIEFEKVIQGDNSYRIAKRVGVPQQQLINCNPDVDWNRLQIGQQICISCNVSNVKPIPTPTITATTTTTTQPTNNTPNESSEEVVVINCGDGCTPYQFPTDAWNEYILRVEGRGKAGRPGYAYNDNNEDRLRTIGIGSLIDKRRIKPEDTNLWIIIQEYYKDLTTNEQIMAKFNDFYYERDRLTDDQMTKLKELDSADTFAKADELTPNWRCYPPNVQIAIMSGYFRGDLGPKTREFLNNCDLKGAAIEYLNHAGYKKRKAKNPNDGVVKRMEENQKAFLNPVYPENKQINEKPNSTSPGNDIIPFPLGSNQTNKQYITLYIDIESGMTISGLAQEYNTTIKKIVDANPGLNPDVIKVGQTIKVVTERNI